MLGACLFLIMGFAAVTRWRIEIGPLKTASI
jgi:hypothetical protein